MEADRGFWGVNSAALLMMMTSWSLCMMNRLKTELIRSLFLSEIAYLPSA